MDKLCREKELELENNHYIRIMKGMRGESRREKDRLHLWAETTSQQSMHDKDNYCTSRIPAVGMDGRADMGIS